MATIFELAARLQSAHVAEELLLVLAKATLILLIARLLLAVMPRASAATKHLVATAALVAVASMPLLSVLLPAWNIVVATKAAPVAAAAQKTAPVRGTIGVADDEPVSVTKTFVKAIAPAPMSAMERISTTVRSSWKGMFVLFAAVVAMLMLAHMVAGMIGVWRIARGAREVGDDVALQELDRARDQLALRADVRLLQSERVTVPLVWGLFRPVLLLPVDAARWSAEKLRVVLLHELAHLKRVDGISLILTRIAVSLFWFHPVAWSLERAGRSECERACDDLVLAGGTKPSEYADHLLEIARTMPPFDPYRAVTLAMSRKSQLEGRLLSILQPGGARRAFSGRTVAIACALAVAVIVPVSALRLIAQQAPETKVVEQQQKQEKVRTDSTITVKPHVESLEDYLAGKLDEYGIKHHRNRAPETAREWYEHATDLYHDDRFAEAGDAYRRAAEKSDEREPTALYNAACSYALAGDAARASDALAEALGAGWDDVDKIAEDSDFDPIRGDSRFRAVVAKFAGDVVTRRETRALEQYEALRSGRAEKKDDWYDVGLDLLRLRRFDQSIDAFERSMAHNEKNAAAAYNIACAHSLRGDVRGGIQWLDTAIEQGFGDDEKFRNDPDIAALRTQPEFRSLLQKARDLELRAGDDRWPWEEASSHHKEMLSKYPNSGRAWFNYGYTSLQARDFANAMNAFRKTISMNYRPGTSAYNIACAYALQGDRDAAFEWLQKAEGTGFRLSDYLEDDEDLDALRRDPRFAALKERFRDWSGD